MRCRNQTTGEQFAVKVLARESHNKKTEIDTLRMCQGHPNVVRLVEVLEDETFTYIVTELLEGGELNDRTARMAPDQLDDVFRQIFEGVGFIHGKGVAHRDLKPENIVFESATSNQVRIVDFGFAKQLIDVKGMNYLEYTLDYASPEVLHCNTMGGMSMASDYWSIGAIMYRSACGRLPFGDGDSVGDRIRQGSFDKEVAAWKRVSSEVRQVIEGLLLPNPADRFNRETIRETLWYQSSKEPDSLDEEEVVVVVPMEIDVSPAVVPEEEDAVLVETDTIVDDLELPLQVVDDDEEVILRFELPHAETEPPHSICESSVVQSDTDDLVVDMERNDLASSTIPHRTINDDDSTSLHSMASNGDADDIKTMELFNNNEKFVDEQCEAEEPPVWKDEQRDERERIMEEIHCDEYEVIVLEEPTQQIAEEPILKPLLVDLDDEKEFLGFDANFCEPGRIVNPYLLDKNRRIRLMVIDLKHEQPDSTICVNDRPRRTTMIRCDYARSGPFKIPFRKRGHSRTMITKRFTSAHKQTATLEAAPVVSEHNYLAATNLSGDCMQTVPTISDHNTMAATNLSADAAAARASASDFSSPLTPPPQPLRPPSRASGRKRQATSRLVDEIRIKPKITKRTSSNISSAAKASKSTPAKPSNIAPAAAPIITPPKAAEITPPETTSYIITSYDTHHRLPPPPPPPPLSSTTKNRRRTKRTIEIDDEEIVFVAPPSNDSVTIIRNTTTRSGRRSVIPRPFVQPAFRIKVEASH